MRKYISATIHYKQWAEPVKLRWALLISLLWPLQRYTKLSMPYHRAWARAVRL